ncbi:MAG: DUF1573 domain-containing protein, partial [Phycisphaerae bacterium]|nr:DUF1573 domain-containing protein [Phycisphaerae bacterium]
HEPLKTTTTLTNRTDAMLSVKRMISSCACTTARLVGARDIGPGESRTIEIEIDLTGVGGKSQRVDFAGSLGPLGSVRVDYEIVPPVKATVEAADLGEGFPTAQVNVVRDDGQPVKLLRVEPAIGEIKTLPDGKQVAVLDLAKADAYAGSEAGKEDGSFIRDADGTWASMYVRVVTDYPGCPNASVFVRRVR